MANPAIVLIAPYLTPGSIGPRAIRSRRIAEGLAAAGHEVRPIAIDDGRLGELSGLGPPLATAPGPLVGGMSASGTGRRRRLRSRLVAAAQFALPVPDPHGRWAAQLLRCDELRVKPPDAGCIYAVGPPYSSLVLGAALSRRWSLPLVGDLGDPWPSRGPVLRRLERRTMSALDALIVTNQRTAEHFAPMLGAGTEVLIAANGAEPVRRSTRPGRPFFVQLGTLSPLRTDPGPIFEALSSLDRDGVIEFASYGEAWVALSPEAAHHHHGVVPPDQALELMAEATALVVVGNRNPAQIPSKVYDVLASDVRALYISELREEPGAELLRRSGHAVVSANEVAAITEAARKLIGLEAAGSRPHPSSEHSWQRTVERAVGVVESVAQDSASKQRHI